MNKKVYLIYSGEESRKPRIPLSLLALASWLKKYGYEPEIYDLRLKEEVDFLPKPLCVCFSAMTGPDLKPGIEMAKWVKNKYPEIPIIFGGHHVSATKKREEFMDSIIIGEGELALLKCIKDIEKGELKQTYNQKIIDLNLLDVPSYDLINFDDYFMEEFEYECSRGCPCACTFCYVEYFHYRRWRTKKAEKIINEIKLLHKKYNFKKIKFMGDNFFVNKKIVLEVCEGIKDLNLKWSSTCRADYFENFNDKEMLLLKDSGCWMLQIGLESGSQEMLDYLQKGITVQQSIYAVKRCVEYGILPLTSFVIGIPNETWQQLNQTLNLYDKVWKLGSEVNGVFILHPYIGTRYYEDTVKLGFKAPQSIDDWADLQLRRIKLPWHGGRSSDLETITKISRFKFFIKHLSSFSKESIKQKTGVPMSLIKLGILPFRAFAFLRWKFRFFKAGYDFKLFFYVLGKFTEIY